MYGNDDPRAPADRDSAGEQRENEESASKDEHDDDRSSLDLSLFRPLYSAADAGPSNRTRVWFDDHIGEMLQEHAKRRAPGYSYRRHLIGIAGEVGVGTAHRVPINRRILPDYKGDGGFDLRISHRHWDERIRIEVKTTTNRANPERTVSPRKIDQADMFVLCATDAPTRYVDIVGYAPRPLLKLIGTAYGREGYLLAPNMLFPVVPRRFDEDDVRDAMYR